MVATWFVAWCAALPADAAAQASPAPLPKAAPGTANPHVPLSAGPRRVSGRVLRRVGDSTAAVPSTWATLHRVGPDAAGPIDSVKTDASGSFRFSYKASGSDRAIYFVSSSAGGIAYFTPPLKAASVASPDGDVIVFDTTSVGVTVAVRGHHMIVQAPHGDGVRQLVEVYDIENTGAKTFVSPPGDKIATFEVPVSPKANNLAAGQSDVPAEAMKFGGARVRVFAPIPPGVKQIAFTYDLEAGAFPLKLTTITPGSVVEVIVEEPTATVSGPKLGKATNATIEGRQFRRFLVADAPASSEYSVGVAGGSSQISLKVIVAFIMIGAVVLIGLAAAGQRRPAIGVATPRMAQVGFAGLAAARLDDPEKVARDIADLDLRFERHSSPSEAERAAYRAERDALKARLTALLARSDVPT
jgi:hypothetical protein